MRNIKLTRGYVVVVDDADHAELSRFKWYAFVCVQQHRTYVYACRREYPSRRHVYMHREIAMPDPALQVDHVNGDTLDNRRENLRCATKDQNQQNRRKTGRASSQWKGVWRHHQNETWCAEIKVNKEKIGLGSFKSEEAAARAYDAAARRWFGEFARLNFPRANERATIARIE